MPGSSSIHAMTQCIPNTVPKRKERVLTLLHDRMSLFEQAYRVANSGKNASTSSRLVARAYNSSKSSGESLNLSQSEQHSG